MDQKASKDKLRKSTTKFKYQRSHMHKQRVHSNSTKEAKEGNTYQSNIGLNLNPNSSKDQMDVLAVNILNLKVSNEQLKLFESYIPQCTNRPTPKKFSYDKNSIYNFIVYDIETNTLGKKAEICQLSATDQSGLHCFNCFMLPSRDVDIHATRVNGLSVRSIHGQRTLLKENQPVVTVPLENALADF